MHWKRSNPNYNCNRRDTVALKVSCNKNVKFNIFKIRTCCRYTGYFTTAKLNLGRTEPLLARGSDIAGLNALYQGCSTFLLLPAALLLFIWDTAANEFELYLWDTTKCQPTQNTFIISKIFAYSFCNSLWHHSDCYASCRLILFLPCVCFASIHASTAAKSYILNCVWTAANFIIEGRMWPCDRRLCTVALYEEKAVVIINIVLKRGYYNNCDDCWCQCQKRYISIAIANNIFSGALNSDFLLFSYYGYGAAIFLSRASHWILNLTAGPDQTQNSRCMDCLHKLI